MGFVDVFLMLDDWAQVLGSGVWSVAGGVVGWVVGTVASFLLMVTAALPYDIFNLPTVVGSWEVGVSWLNWFVPIGQIELLLVAWVAATLAYYAAKYIFNFIADRFHG